MASSDAKRQSLLTFFLVVASIVATFFLARWLVVVFTTPERAEITITPEVLPFSPDATAKLEVQLYNKLGIPLADPPQIMLEITEGFEVVTIDSVYPGGAILRPARRPGTATIRIWISGFLFPYEVTLTVSQDLFGRRRGMPRPYNAMALEQSHALGTPPLWRRNGHTAADAPLYGSTVGGIPPAMPWMKWGIRSMVCS